MLFSQLKHHFDLNITDTALKVSRSLYCFTTSISHGVENYFPRLWGTGISDAIFKTLIYATVIIIISPQWSGKMKLSGKSQGYFKATMCGNPA